MSKDKLIPDLRFPEFVNEEEWEEKRISELGETVNGLTGKSGEDFGTGKPYITYKQVFDNSIIDFEKCGKVQINANENQNALQIGDILFTTSSETPNEVGFASVLVDSPKETTYLNSFCFSLRPFYIKETLPEFSRYLFHSPIYRKSISALAQGSTRYNISKGAFLTLKLPIPNPKEQQKIASCLSSLDEVIVAHSQKLDLLKDHKKGLMHNLFPNSITNDQLRITDENSITNYESSITDEDDQFVIRNSQTRNLPKYLFKEFENDGEWSKFTLGKICKITSGGTPNRSESKFWNGDIPWVSTTLIDFNTINEVNEYITEIGLKNSSAKIFPKGTILMAMYGQGKTRGKVGVLGIDAATNQACAAILLKAGYNTNFVFQYLAAHYDGIRELSNKGGQENLSGGLIEIVPITIPNPKEQQKITSCLSSLDALITAQKEKIEQLKLHKKGLMQGLFPKIND